MQEWQRLGQVADGAEGSNVLRMSSGIQIKTKSSTQKSKTCSAESQPKPSAKLNPKTIDPFRAYSQPSSAFAATYARGGIPCSSSLKGCIGFFFFLPLLKAHADDEVFGRGLDALVQLSAVVGPSLNDYLKLLLTNLLKRLMDKKYREEVTVALQKLEHCGGRVSRSDVYSVIYTF
ncbi:hypothetical protein EK904_014298 [Melospiza melodia maxima]|nr:hypothetical protein EK904_014298 [Melospiza melodia maxima]